MRLSISELHKPEVLRTLRVLMGHATAQAGCEHFSVAQDVGDAQSLTVRELWVSRVAFDAHLRSEDYRLMLAVIDLSITAPEISFDDLSHLGGLDVIQALRGPKSTLTGGNS